MKKPTHHPPKRWYARSRVWLLAGLAIAGAAALGIYLRSEALYAKGSPPAANGAHHGPEGESEAPSVKQSPTVRLVKPRSRDITRIVGQPSFVEAYERTSIYPKVTGYIEQWNVDIGDQVKKGQVLARLYVPELVEYWETKKATVKLDEEKVDLAKKVVKVAEANVMAAEAKLKEAKEILAKFKAQMDRWDSEVDRLKREVDRGVIDPQVLLESENQFKASTAGYYAAQAAIERATADLLSMETTKDQDEIAVDVALADLKVAESEAKRYEAWVSYLDLISPFDGVVTVRNANTWDFVAPKVGDPSADERSPHLSPSGSAAPIYVVDRTDVVRVFMDVPERDAKFVKKGTPATVYIRAFRDHPIAATVSRTSWALNQQSRTLRAEIDLHNTEYKTVPGLYEDQGDHQYATENGAGDNPQILPGMYAYARAVIERKAVPAIPVRATFAVGDRTFCWFFQDGKAVRGEIRTGLSDDQWIEVTNYRIGDSEWRAIEGHEPVIMTEDLGILAEGLPVRVSAEEETEPSQTAEIRGEAPQAPANENKD